MAWQGDYNANPQNPFLHLYGLVTGRAVAVEGEYIAVDDSAHEPGTICEPPEWLAQELITVDQALPMFTINAAYALGQESVIGSLEPGKYADVVIISKNLIMIDPDDIKDVEVLMTMVGGHVEYCGAGAEALCAETTQ